MNSPVRTLNAPSISLFVLVLAAALAMGCGEDEKPGFFTGDGNSNAGTGGGSGDGDGDGDSSGDGDGDSGGDGDGDSGGDGDGDSGGDGDGDSGGDGDGDSGGDGDGDVTLPTSPANPWIAFIQIDSSGFGQLRFVKADGSGEIEYGGDTFSETDPAWSPDGTKLAIAAIDVEDGNVLTILDFDAGTSSNVNTGLANFSRPRWTDGGDTIVVAGSTEIGDTTTLFRIDVSDGGNEAITSSDSGDGGHDVGPNGTIYFVRNLGGGNFDVFSVGGNATPSDSPERVTNGSAIIGGVTVHPDGSKMLYAKAAGNTTDLIEHTFGGSEATIGNAGDEQPSYFVGGDGMVVNRDSFDSDSEIAVTDTAGALTTRCTDDGELNTTPAVGGAESDDIDVSQF